MSNFNPEKLSVKYIPPTTDTNPVLGRKYTLTHSDITAKLFLSVGDVYDYDSINKKMRDEVIAQWQLNQQYQYILMGKAYISGGEFGEARSAVRFNIFQKEMDTAIKAMIYGDRKFYYNYPYLMDGAIYIYYQSVYPQFRTTIYYGTPRQYLKEIL